MVDTYKLSYGGNNVLTYPGWDGYCDYTLTGTFTDVLYQATGMNGVNSGTLSGSIYDYDMITIYPRNLAGNGAEMGIGTKYCPKDIPAAGRMHLFAVNGGGNMYMTDAAIQWDKGSAFTAGAITTSNPGMRITAGMSISGTTGKFERHSTYTTGYGRVGKIVGTKYLNNRDLLFSASTTAKMPQTISISKPFTAYDFLQVKVSNNQAMADNNYEKAGYWTEYYSDLSTATVHFQFIGGNGTMCYLNSLVGGWNNSTSLTLNVGKPLVWNVTTTAAVTQTPNYSANYYISEIWGVK